VKLKDKVAVVTGAATGIGQAIAIAFAGEGASVVVDYVGADSVRAATVQAITAMKGDVLRRRGCFRAR
jgi:NAD(P)-dependent dehydrogenase (short-subunit alcohol dehydrogenase family)